MYSNQPSSIANWMYATNSRNPNSNQTSVMTLAAPRPESSEPYHSATTLIDDVPRGISVARTRTERCPQEWALYLTHHPSFILSRAQKTLHHLQQCETPWETLLPTLNFGSQTRAVSSSEILPTDRINTKAHLTLKTHHASHSGFS